MTVPKTGSFSMFGSSIETIQGAIVQGGAVESLVMAANNFNVLKGYADINRFDQDHSEGATNISQITKTSQFRGYPISSVFVAIPIYLPLRVSNCTLLVSEEDYDFYYAFNYIGNENYFSCYGGVLRIKPLNFLPPIIVPLTTISGYTPYVECNMTYSSTFNPRILGQGGYSIFYTPSSGGGLIKIIESVEGVYFEDC